MFAKTYGWDLEAINKLTASEGIFLLETMIKEHEEQERELKKLQSKVKKKW